MTHARFISRVAAAGVLVAAVGCEAPDGAPARHPAAPAVPPSADRTISRHGVAPPPPPPVPGVPPVTVRTGTYTLANAFNDVVQLVTTGTPRMRLELWGDVPAGSGPQVASLGSATLGSPPSITFTGGDAQVTLHGTTTSITSAPLVFGPLMPAGFGNVVATDAAGDVLEVIWPQFAGLPPGPPRFRVQLASWNQTLVPPGVATPLDLSFDARATDLSGDVATFHGAASGLLSTGGLLNPPVVACAIGGLTPGNLDLVTTFANVPRFQVGRLRTETWADTPAGATPSLTAVGPCGTGTAPMITFPGGTATVSIAGVPVTAAPLTFGPLTVPPTGEQGVVLSTDSVGDVLEIIWPALAGLPPGPPRIRVQLASWLPGTVASGKAVDVAFSLQGLDPAGHATTWTGGSTGLVVP